MSFIEGVGDEVTAFAVVLLVLILAATVTFLLNSTPFSERRHVSRIDPSISPLVNQGQNSDRQTHDEQQASHSERNNQSNVGIDTIDPNPASSSAVNTEEVQNTTDDTPPDETDNDKVSSEGAANSQLYPEISDCDSISGHISETSDADNEERPTSNPEDIHIRLKYLDDTERSVTSHPTVKIGDFKRIHFAEDIANNKSVRLIFSGQLLQDNATLQSYGVANNCVVHVQILQAQTQQGSTSASQNSDLDLSHLLWPLLSVILGICWILYFKYPEFFNLMSLGILFLFTGSFVYFYCQVQHQ